MPFAPTQLLPSPLRRASRTLSGRVLSAFAEPRVRKVLSGRPAAAHETPFAVYFADGPAGLYQLGQWLRPLEELARQAGPVALLVGDARAAGKLADATHLPVVLVPGSAHVEDFVREHGVAVVFYVNNNQSNFTTLRLNGPAHVHLSHGESEKVSMVSNQLKAYDFAFIAGPAARERILAHVPRFDAGHLVEIGRPQLDQVVRHGAVADGRITVLYAPTWEGDSSGMAYGSVATHGADLAAQVLADPSLRLVYRPHPKTGELSTQYGAAHRRLAALIAAQSPQGHRLDTAPTPWAALAEADVVVSDVSAMAIDAVGLGIPVVVCTSAAEAVSGGGTTGAGGSLTTSAHAWTGRVPSGAAAQLRRLASAPPSSAQESYRRYVFGADPAPGAETARFVAAASALLPTI